METRRKIERWFAARGVPQLIEGYSTEQRMDARALPWIGAWIVIGTFLIWTRRPELSQLDNVVAGTIALIATLAVLAAILFLRGHLPFRASARLDLLDIALIGLVPAVAAAIVHGEQSVVLRAGGSVLLGVGAIYLVIGFGLVEIGAWALVHLRAQLTQISTLVARTLPVLLILVVFLLFACGRPRTPSPAQISPRSSLCCSWSPPSSSSRGRARRSVGWRRIAAGTHPSRSWSARRPSRWPTPCAAGDAAR